MKAQTLIRSMSSLIQTNQNALNAYEKAAETVENPLLTSTFKDIADKHKAFVDDLSKVVSEFGGDPKKSSSNAMKSSQAGWKNMQTLIKDGDASLLLEECVSSGKSMLNAYREAMRYPVPDGIIDMVWEQYDIIKESRQQLENLRTVVN